MSKLSIKLSETARNNVSLILHSLNSQNQREIAEVLGVDPSSLSRMKTEKKSNNNLTQVEFISAFTDSIGLKLVQKEDALVHLKN